MTTATQGHPIIMSADSVRAILGGRKTQTRRVVKPQPSADTTDVFVWEAPELPASVKAAEGLYCRCPDGLRFLMSCLYPVGSSLWVRETWTDIHETFPGNLHYKASATNADLEWFVREGWRWRSPIFMPRWASRITLEVVGVRAERLQDITDVDARAEGVLWVEKEVDGQWQPCATEQYRYVWDSINARRGYPWVSNPWVWVVEFKRIGGEG